MRVFYENGICLQEGIKEVVLDPHRSSPGSIVTHAHLDHLSKGALMTPETLAIMKVRLGGGSGKPLPFGRKEAYHGFEVRFHEAGHTLGSAMVEVNDVLYTGDFNPEGGLTCGKAAPRSCETLIMESTYGAPHLSLPPKRDVENDIVSWTEAELAKSSVAFAAIEFGKAQELVALLNTMGKEVVVSDGIAAISDVYVRHGHKLQYRPLRKMTEEERKEHRVYVVPRGWLGRETPKEFAFFREDGGSCALVSGWCAVFDFTRSNDLTAQFPLSDHGDFDDLLDFAGACKPHEVYTVGGNAQLLAKEISDRMGVSAQPLHRRKGRKNEVSH